MALMRAYGRQEGPRLISIRVWLGLVLALAAMPAAATTEVPPTITIDPMLPRDIQGGAPKANLQQAAVFAWQEFIDRAASTTRSLLWGTAELRGEILLGERPD